MQEQININILTVNNILRKLRMIEEEVKILVSEADKTIESAELEGWSDSRYNEFKDQFLDTKTSFLMGIKRIEEEHVPFLKKIINAAENF